MTYDEIGRDIKPTHYNYIPCVQEGAGKQEKAAEAPAADQPKQEKEITVSPEQMKRTWAIFWVSRAVSNLVPFLP